MTSFGFSPGDIAAVIALAVRTYERWKAACDDYTEVANDLNSFKLILRRMEVAVERGVVITADDANDLRDVLAASEKTFKGLRVIASKYASLGTSERRSIGIGYKADDIAKLSGRLHKHVTFLTAFLQTVIVNSLERLEKHSRRRKTPRPIGTWATNAVTNGTHVSDTESTAASLWTEYPGDDRAAWRQWRRELVKDGFSSDDITQHGAKLRSLLTTLKEEEDVDLETCDRAGASTVVNDQLTNPCLKGKQSDEHSQKFLQQEQLFESTPHTSRTLPDSQEETEPTPNRELCSVTSGTTRLDDSKASGYTELNYFTFDDLLSTTKYKNLNLVQRTAAHARYLMVSKLHEIPEPFPLPSAQTGCFTTEELIGMNRFAVNLFEMWIRMLPTQTVRKRMVSSCILFDYPSINHISFDPVLELSGNLLWWSFCLSRNCFPDQFLPERMSDEDLQIEQCDTKWPFGPSAEEEYSGKGREEGWLIAPQLFLERLGPPPPRPDMSATVTEYIKKSTMARALDESSKPAPSTTKIDAERKSAPSRRRRVQRDSGRHPNARSDVVLNKFPRSRHELASRIAKRLWDWAPVI